MKHKNLIEEKYKYLVDIFKLKDKELFSNKDILKLDYFNFEILHEYYRYNFGEFAERFLYQYIFSKTKGNKYLFKVIYNEYENCNGNLFDITNEEIKYCDNNNYNEYYFYDNKLDAKESSYYYKIVNNEKIKSLYLIDNNDDYLEQFKKNKNNVEIISIKNLNLDDNNFITNLKNFTKMKSFFVESNCSFDNNNQIIELLNSLSKFINLFSIKINIGERLKLSNSEFDKINKMFKDITIENKKSNCIIEWNNNRLKFHNLKN